MTGVSVAAVGQALRAVLEDAGTPLLLHDRATGEVLPLPLRMASDPAGLLPVFLVAGDAVREEATGDSLALRIARDPDALLGYRLDGIGAGTFATAMLFTMEAVAQAREAAAHAAGADGLLVNALLSAVWQAVIERADRASAMPPPPAPRAAPSSGPSP